MDFHKEIESIHIYKKSKTAKPILIEKETNIDKYVFYFKETGKGTKIELGGKKVIIFNKNEIEIEQKESSDMGRKEIWATGSILDGNSSGRFFRDYLTGRYDEDGLGVVYKVYGVGDETDGYRYFTGPQKSGATKGKYFQGIPNSQIDKENNLKTVPINNFYDLAGSFGNCRSEGGVELRSGKKPEELLKIILSHFSKENDIVLDYHLGSGTTAAVAHKMKRQFLGLEQLDYGDNDSVNRIKNVIAGDITGISKAVNWKGGGEFVYLELKKYNQTFVEKIESAKDSEALLKVWEEMKAKSFLNYNVDIVKQEKHIEEFKKDSVLNQKKLLIKLLDKNQLYVNLSSLNDKELSTKEKKELTIEEKEYKSLRKQIQDKLIKFATRIPVFMYLTDYRERSLRDVITKLEPGLFKKVTGLTVKDFELLVSLGVFNSGLMNDAVYKFKRYEDASLEYIGINKHSGEDIGLYDTVLSRHDYENIFVNEG